MKMLNVPEGYSWGISRLIVLDNETAFNDTTWCKSKGAAMVMAAQEKTRIFEAMRISRDVNVCGNPADTVIEFAHTIIDASHVTAYNYEIYQVFDADGKPMIHDEDSDSESEDVDKSSHTIPDAQCVRDDEDDEDNSDTSAKPQEYCTRGALGADDSSDDD